MLTDKKALQLSIQHWKRILAGKDRCRDADSCALCGKYVQMFECCVNCPLERAGMRCTQVVGGIVHLESPWSKTGVIGVALNAKVIKSQPWTRKETETVEVMLMCLLLVREALEDLPKTYRQVCITNIS